MFQDAMLQKLTSDNFLSQEERFVACPVSFLALCIRLIMNFVSMSKGLDTMYCSFLNYLRVIQLH